MHVIKMDRTWNGVCRFECVGAVGVGSRCGRTGVEAVISKLKNKEDTLETLPGVRLTFSVAMKCRYKEGDVLGCACDTLFHATMRAIKMD
ncbi:hypothetical protein NDU88_005199 [Pleurodeles waltl]|uniref:Uncharacterized protein n=1 Tax=Pleurodeles waltl TaxID=8319 RepID=A0AAV7TU45_PLEWA|nr:hypothetical protein NDU88_005199 [Pleurodeles waltl]